MYAALISNISERDRAKDVEQFVDILRNFINETSKYEGRLGKIRDEEKTPAVEKLMPESLRNYRFRGTTLPYEELLIALENIKDKVTTPSASKVKKIDTSAPREIGMAAGTDGEETFEEGCGRTSELALQAVYKGTGGKGGRNGEKGPSWSVQKHFHSGKGEKGANRAGQGHGPRPEARKEEKGKRKGDIRVCWSCGPLGHIAANCVKGSWNRSLNAAEEDKGDTGEEVREDDDELRAWCLLEESENEQWQEVVSKKSKLKSKKVAHESLLSVDNKSCASRRKVIEAKDNCENIRATMDT